MIAISLQSGSNGNCIYVEAGGVKLLFDAGISGAAADERLAAHGRDIRSVDAVIISHDHGDHVRCAGIYQRKYGLPLYTTQRTIDRACSRLPLGKLRDVRLFTAGDTLRFNGVTVETTPTPHDGADGAVFVVSSGGARLGILTDLGHVFPGLQPLVASLDAVFLESNYDPGMLECGPYPEFLRQRIRGDGGHISNREAAELLCSAGNLKWACLAHLSEQNNSTDVALRTHRAIVPKTLLIHVASRYRVSDVFTI